MNAHVVGGSGSRRAVGPRPRNGTHVWTVDGSSSVHRRRATGAGWLWCRTPCPTLLPSPSGHACYLLAVSGTGSQQRQERMGQKSSRPSDDTTREQGFRNQEHVVIPPAVPDDHEPEFGLRNIVRSAVARCHGPLAVCHL